MTEIDAKRFLVGIEIILDEMHREGHLSEEELFYALDAIGEKLIRENLFPDDRNMDL